VALASQLLADQGVDVAAMQAAEARAAVGARSGGAGAARPGPSGEDTRAARAATARPQERHAHDGRRDQTPQRTPGQPAGRQAGAPPANGQRATGEQGRSPHAPQAKLGRNDPCWCGSGKKFKLCHGSA
jgi:preprotein translocase subunit SecA